MRGDGGFVQKLAGLMRMEIGCLRLLHCGAVAAVLGVFVVEVQGQSYEEAPFFYTDTEAKDPTAQLVEKIQLGSVRLDTSSDQAFLKDLLTKLEVPVASQVLVYSKTSFQNSRITPTQPRAIYFSDDHYVGWVQGGDIEIISIDPKLGPVFYVLEIPRPPKRPLALIRHHECLSCHGTSRTGGVPGMLVRSVRADARGFPILSAGTHLSDHASPLSERWGGWYVTGESASPHMGNQLHREKERGGAELVENHGQLESLEGVISTQPYLTDKSDIVALMVLEHQITVHNLLTQSGYNVRKWIHYDGILKDGFDDDTVGVREATQRLIEGQVKRLLDVMLFKNELALESWGVEGDEAFQEAFLANAKASKKGRSLRDFQLLSRLFRHRLSYMIYSQSFDHLPQLFKEAFYEKLHGVLIGDDLEGYPYLISKERQRILDILVETKEDYAEFIDGR